MDYEKTTKNFGSTTLYSSSIKQCELLQNRQTILNVKTFQKQKPLSRGFYDLVGDTLRPLLRRHFLLSLFQRSNGRVQHPNKLLRLQFLGLLVKFLLSFPTI